jgi:Bifunctional DNA primase/polymerase, N-terminal
MTQGGIFSTWQPDYAAHGIPTFPVTAEKKPATRGYLRTGLRGSAELASRFTDADAFGFACGPRSKITLLDVDSADERALADALSIFGKTPLISQTRAAASTPGTDTTAKAVAFGQPTNRSTSLAAALRLHHHRRSRRAVTDS